MKLPYTTKWDEYYELGIDEKTGDPIDPRPFQRWIDREGEEYIFIPDWPLNLDEDASEEEMIEAYAKHHDYDGEGVTWKYTDYVRFVEAFQEPKHKTLRLVVFSVLGIVEILVIVVCLAWLISSRDFEPALALLFTVIVAAGTLIGYGGITVS